jgi:hypothetical protein
VLAQALRLAARDGLTHVVLDGTLIHTDRVRANAQLKPWLILRKLRCSKVGHLVKAIAVLRNHRVTQATRMKRVPCS